MVIRSDVLWKKWCKCCLPMCHMSSQACVVAAPLKSSMYLYLSVISLPPDRGLRLLPCLARGKMVPDMQVVGANDDVCMEEVGPTLSQMRAMHAACLLQVLLPGVHTPHHWFLVQMEPYPPHNALEIQVIAPVMAGCLLE